MVPIVRKMLAAGRWPAALMRHLAWVAVVLIAANLMGGGRPVWAAFPGSNGKIIWSQFQVTDADVFVMNTDGSGQTNLTKNPANDIWPVWSPDGSKIAFASDRDGNYEIYVMNADGSAQTRLTNNPADDSQPAWSPDGTKIAFTSLRDGNAEIYVMNANGSGQTNLTNSAGNDLKPVWSPDGTRIAFTSDRDLNLEVYVMNADGGGQTNLTNDPGADADPAWSPDGSRLAFTSNRAGSGNVYVMYANGSFVTQLTNSRSPATDLGPSWSPDGTKIVFTSTRGNGGLDEIYVMNADGTAPRQLTDNPTHNFTPDWQPLGKTPTPPLPAPPPAASPAPPAPHTELSISDVAVTKEFSAYFTVTLSAASSRTVTVEYLTTDAFGPQCAPFACARSGSNYVSRSGLLIFAPGETSKTVRVPILNNNLLEPNQVFVTLLVLPINATIAKQLGVGKITNQSLPYQTAASVTEFSDGFRGHGGGLVLGPDGNFWTTEQFDARLAMFDPRTLKATEFDLPPGTFPHYIIVGPDGNLWFTDLFDRIGTFDLKTKKATTFGVGITPGSVPHFILSAPDGNLYFSEQGEEQIPEPGGRNRTSTHQGKIGQFNLTTHMITEFSGGLPSGTRIHGMTLGTDGNIWATLEATDQLVRFNLATKTFDQFISFSPGSGPHDVIVADNFYFVILTNVGRIGRYDPSTGGIREYPTSLTREDGNSLVFLTPSADRRALWFSEFLNDRIGRMDISTEEATGTMTEYASGITPNSAPIGIVVGPDNNIWFSEPVLDTRFSGRMGRLVLSDSNRFTTAQRAFVGRLYREMLGREVDSTGLDYFGSLLEQGQANRFQVALALLNSREARIQAIQRAYLTVLDRPADAKELSDALGVLQSGGSISQVEATILSSPEYFQRRGGGTNEGFLAALYTDLLGRTPALGDHFVFTKSVQSRGGSPRAFSYILAVGRIADVPIQLGLEKAPQSYPATYSQAATALLDSRAVFGSTTLGQLRQELAAGGSRSAVAAKLIASRERLVRLVQGFYGRFLFRPADSSGLTIYSNALQQGLARETIVAAIVESPEYRGLGVISRP